MEINTEEKQIVLVGDNYVFRNFDFNAISRQTHSRNYESFYFISEPVANFKSVLRLATEYIESNPHVNKLLLFPFLWEFIDFKNFNGEETNPKVIYLKQKPTFAFREYIFEINAATKRWQSMNPNLQVIWFLPYTPNFLRFNETALSDLQWNPSAGDVTEAEIMAKEFYGRVKQLDKLWSKYIADIPMINLHECYFLKEKFMEKSFNENYHSKLYFPNTCTYDGLIPSEEFKYRVYNTLDEKLSVLDYDNIPVRNKNIYQENMQSMKYDSTNNINDPRDSFKKSMISIDYKHSSSPSPVIGQNLKCYPRELNSKSFDQQGYHDDHLGLMNNYNSDRFHNNSSPENSWTYSDFTSQDSASSFYSHKRLNPFDSYNYSHTHQISQQSESSSQMQAPPPPSFGSTDSNPATSYKNTEVNTKKTFSLKDEYDDQASQILTKNPVSLVSGNLMDQIKDALKFLKNTNSQETETKKNLSPYSKHLSLFFETTWKNLFLVGDAVVALYALEQCINSLLKLPNRKGLKVLMMTTSQDFIDDVESKFSKLVEENKIGLNSNIPFGVPWVLVDTPANMLLHLAQERFKNLSDLAAILVFGDSILSHKTQNNTEFLYVLKSILSSNITDSVNKVVISESGSTEAEIVAQNAFYTLFCSPKKDKGTEESNKLSLSEFFMKENDLSTKDEKTKSDTHVSRSENSSMLQNQETNLSLKKDITKCNKLEDILKQASVSVSEDKMKEYDNHDGYFNQCLDRMEPHLKDLYLIDGKKYLEEHESEYETFAEIPDLHPDYEDKYEMFIGLFEQVYGKECEQNHVQSTWKRFWNLFIMSLKDKVWLERKKELQIMFIEKHNSASVESKNISQDKQKVEEAQYSLPYKVEEKRNHNTKTCKSFNKNEYNQFSEEKLGACTSNEGNFITPSFKSHELYSIYEDQDSMKATKFNEGNFITPSFRDLGNNSSPIGNKFSTPAHERKDLLAILSKDSKTPSHSPKVDQDNAYLSQAITKTSNTLTTSSNESNPSIILKKEEFIASKTKSLGSSPMVNKEECINTESPKNTIREFLQNECSRLSDRPIQSKNKAVSEAPNPISNIKKEKGNYSTDKTDTLNLKQKDTVIQSENSNDYFDSEKFLAIYKEEQFKLLKKAEENKTLVKPESTNRLSISSFLTEMAEYDNKRQQQESIAKSYNDAKRSTLEGEQTGDKMSKKLKRLGKDEKMSYNKKDEQKRLKELETKGQDFSAFSSKKREGTKSPQRRDRKHSPRRDSCHSPRKDRCHSPRRDRCHSPKKYRKHSPERKKKHSPKREKKQSPKREKKQSPKREKNHSPKKERKSPPRRSKNLSSNKEIKDGAKSKNNPSPELNISLPPVKECVPHQKPISKTKEQIIDKAFDKSKTLFPSVAPAFTSNKIVFKLSEKSKAPNPAKCSSVNSKPPTKKEKSPSASLDIDEELKNIYIESCKQVSKTDDFKISTKSSRLQGSNSIEPNLKDIYIQLCKQPPSSQSTKPSKTEFDLLKSLEALTNISSEIGMMGPALKTIVECSRKNLPDVQKALTIFADKDSELLMNITINKIKTLITTCSASEKETFRNTILLSQRLLEEAKKPYKRAPVEVSANTESLVDIKAIAKATVGMSTEDTSQFIKNTYVYKGLDTPSEQELDSVFKKVSEQHFLLATKSSK